LPEDAVNRCNTLLLYLLGTLALYGCGPAPEPFPRQPTFPVSGHVLVRGMAAANVQITFTPIDITTWQGPFPTADSEADGSFRVRTYEVADGAPAGRYYLTFVWPTPGEQEERPDRLQDRYSTVTSLSPQVQILAQSNQLTPINLP